MTGIADVRSRHEPTDLGSFSAPLRALVWGATGGVGGALAELLAVHPRVSHLYAAGRSSAPPWQFDLADESSIEAVAARAGAEGPLDLVIVATGMLHTEQLRPEKSWRNLDAEAFSRVLSVNTIGPALIAKHTLGRMRRDAKTVFACLSARVGSIEDNRLGGWHAYRASKAALNMLVRTLAIELRQRHPQAICVTLHPGTVDTALSKPFQSAVAPGGLLEPRQSASALLRVIDRLTPDDSGRSWAWDGQPIPF